MIPVEAYTREACIVDAIGRFVLTLAPSELRGTTFVLMEKERKLPYFLGYKTDFFSFQNYPKDLDPSYKTDLDL